MRLLLDNIIFDLQKVGGISIYWSQILSRAVKDTDIEVTAIPGNNMGKNFTFAEMTHRFPEIAHIRQWMPAINNRYFPIIGKYNAPKQIFHSSYYRPYYGANTKKVVTVHDFMYELFDSGLRKRVHSTQKRISIDNAEIIICISENTKADLLKLYPQFVNKDIRVIYNGVSDAFHILDNAPYKAGRPYLLVVGNRVGCKNFGATMIAYSEYLYKYYDLVIVGKPLSENECKILGEHQKSIVVKNNVPEAELNYMYNNARALVFPSTYEGFGIPAVEAMKAGCPVITTTKSCMREVVGNAGVYMDSQDEYGIVNAVKRLENESFMKTTVQLGLQQSSKFSWDQTYNGVKKIYTELYESI
jgi:mannosyltransferase